MHTFRQQKTIDDDTARRGETNKNTKRNVTAIRSVTTPKPAALYPNNNNNNNTQHIQLSTHASEGEWGTCVGDMCVKICVEGQKCIGPQNRQRQHVEEKTQRKWQGQDRTKQETSDSKAYARSY
eukprot:Opistho-2@52558